MNPVTRMTFLSLLLVFAASNAIPAGHAKPWTSLPTIAVTDWKVHNVGRMHCNITNIGVFGSAPGSTLPFAQEPSAEWPPGSGVEYLWAAGLWIGAEKNAEPAVTTATFGSEFRAGPSGLDVLYETHAGAPGGNRLPFPDADDDHDGVRDEDWLDGQDNDGDNLIDEDFAAYSDQMFVCSYNDFDPSIKLTQPDHEPLNVLVQQTTLAWSRQWRDEYIGFEYKIINLGFDPLINVYVGLFADFDIGHRDNVTHAQDDMAGFEEDFLLAQIGNERRILKQSLAYMFDDDTDAGAAEGYIGILFLGADDPLSPGVKQHAGLHNFRVFSGDLPFDQGGDPTTDLERYRVLDGTAPLSIPPLDSLSHVRPDFRTSEPADYRTVLSVGPFEYLGPGDTLGVQLALVIGRGFDRLKDNAALAQLDYDGLWFDCDGDSSTGVDGNESPVCGSEFAGQHFRINECDVDCDSSSPSDPNCWIEVPQTGCAWINADCDWEELTGYRTGVDGREWNTRWIFDVPVPVQLTEFSVSYSDGRVDVRWRLQPASMASMRRMRLQRSTTPEGPFEAISPAVSPEAVMFFQDRGIEASANYWYRILFEMLDGSIETSRTLHVETTSDAAFSSALQTVSQVSSDAPVEIRYRLAMRARHVRLSIYDVQGRRVRNLSVPSLERGEHLLQWDLRSDSGATASRGVYLISLRTDGVSHSRKFVLLRN